MIASSSCVRALEQGFFGPIRASEVTAICGLCSLMGQGRKPLPDVDALGCQAAHLATGIVSRVISAPMP